jgi:hypothetical protein
MFTNRHPDSIAALSDIVIGSERGQHGCIVRLGRGSREDRTAILIAKLHGRLVMSGAIARYARAFYLKMTQSKPGDCFQRPEMHINRALKPFATTEMRPSGASVGDPRRMLRASDGFTVRHPRTHKPCAWRRRLQNWRATGQPPTFFTPSMRASAAASISHAFEPGATSSTWPVSRTTSTVDSSPAAFAFRAQFSPSTGGAIRSR